MSEITPNTPNPVREDAYVEELATKLGIDPQYIPGSPIWHSEEEIAAIAEMFANMSGGSSGGGVLEVHMVYDEVKDADYTDKTWKEIHDAPMAVIVQENALGGNTTKTTGSVTQVAHQDSEYNVSYYALSLMGEITVSNLVTDSENGYLTWAE